MVTLAQAEERKRKDLKQVADYARKDRRDSKKSFGMRRATTY